MFNMVKISLLFLLCSTAIGFKFPHSLKYPITVFDRLFTKLVSNLPPSMLQYVNLVPMNSTASFHDQVTFVNVRIRDRLIEATSVREIGKALVATYYSDTFHVANVTLNRDKMYAYANYWELNSKTIKTVRPIEQDLHRKFTVVAAGIAAEFMYYEDDTVKQHIPAGPMSKSQFEDAYSILYMHKDKFHILVRMLMSDSVVDGKIISDYIHENDICNVIEDCSF